MIGKAKKETYIVYKVAVICDDCSQANQYAVPDPTQLADLVPCGNVECSREFTKAEMQALIDAAD